MRTGPPRHRYLRRSKSKQRRQRPNKNYKVLASQTTNDDEANQIEPAHSLLLSSLKFWEVERDLIDERKAAIGQ
jgi:hypothetical protein